MASDPICFLKIGLMGVSAQRGHDILTKGRSPSKNNRKGERERDLDLSAEGEYRGWILERACAFPSSLS